MMPNPFSTIKNNLEEKLNKTVSRMRTPVLAAMAAATIYSCSKDGGEEPYNPPEPTPTPTASVIVNINAQQPGVKYDAWKGGKSLDSDISGSDGDAQLVIKQDLLSTTGKGSSNLVGKAAGTLDSITGTKGGKQTFIQTNISVDDAQATNIAVNDYSHTINVDCNSGNTTYQGYKNGNTIVNGTVDQDGFGNATFYDFEQETTLDSLVFKPNYLDFQDQTFVNQTIGESKDYLVLFVRASENQSTVGFTPTVNGFAEQGFEVTIDGQTYQTDGPNLVIEGLQPGTKNITIKDLGADGLASTQGDSQFLPYETTLEFVAGNNSFSPSLEDVPNTDSLSFTIRNNETKAIDTNANVEVYDSNNNLLGSGSPDANGVFTVDNVPSGTSFYVKTSGSGNYTTTFNSRTTPSSNNTIDDMTENYGVMTFSPGQLKDGSSMTTTQLNELMFDEWPVQVITTGVQYMYIPEGTIRDDLLVFFSNFYTELGRRTEFVQTPLANDASIQPYPDFANYNVSQGANGVNVLNYTGTGTTAIKLTLPDGIGGNIGAESNLDGLDFGGTGHEGLRHLSVPASTNATLGYSSATNTNSADNTNPLSAENIGDLPITKYLLDAGEFRVKYEYQSTDGAMWSYAFPQRFD